MRNPSASGLAHPNAVRFLGTACCGRLEDAVRDEPRVRAAWMCLCFFGRDCFQQPELFLSAITINKARARWVFFFIFHSKYFLHPVSSQFTRWTGVCSSKEAHEAISSSSSSSSGLMPSPAPAPAPGTPTVPSHSLQSKGQVLLGRNERNTLHTCVRAHSHTHTQENTFRAKGKKK